MIKIKIYQKSNKIYGLECSGHSGYAEIGSDIVCSAVSSLVCACHLGFLEVANAKFEHKQNDKNAYFKLILKQDNQIAEAILKTTVLSLEQIAKDYKKYVAITKQGE